MVVNHQLRDLHELFRIGVLPVNDLNGTTSCEHRENTAQHGNLAPASFAAETTRSTCSSRGIAQRRQSAPETRRRLCTPQHVGTRPHCDATLALGLTEHQVGDHITLTTPTKRIPRKRACGFCFTPSLSPSWRSKLMTFCKGDSRSSSKPSWSYNARQIEING